jgi:hypothetical protein
MWYVIGVYILLIGNVDAIIFKKQGLIKFPTCQSRYVTFKFPHLWHSRYGKTLFPHARLCRLCGNNASPCLLYQHGEI